MIRIKAHSKSRESFLGAIKSVARATGAEARNPKWTSHGALELDIFVPSKSDLETFLAAAEPLGKLEFQHDLNLAPPHLSDEELFAEARSLFNTERYWECHETLEGAWRKMEGAEKRYVQGMILVCAAFVHHQKGEEEVALSVLRRSIVQLDFGATYYHGIDVNSLRRHSERILSEDKFEPFRL